MTLRDDTVDRGLELFLVLVRERPELSAELEASAEEFFGGRLPQGDARETLLAARRHLEWFVLERHSPSLFRTPVEGLLSEWLERAGPELGAHGDAFLSSFTGVFEVRDVHAGRGAWLADLAGFGEYPVEEPAGSAALETEDIIVGRLFPLEPGRWHVSRAAGVVRSPELLRTLERDLGKIRAERGGSRVVRLSQRVLETTFWRPATAHTSERDPVLEARRLLATGGLDEASIRALFERLGELPFDPSRLVYGAGDELADVLDALAFETEVDLTRARALLIEAWAKLAAPEPAAQPAPAAETVAQRDRRAALAAFEAGRAAGRDLDELFEELERSLAIDDDDDGEDLGGLDAVGDAGAVDDASTTPAPDFPGVVGAMVEEFLWELGQSGRGEDATRFRLLRKLSRFAEPIGAFEGLGRPELLRFAAFWVHEQDELRDGGTARTLVDALDAFCHWAEKTHDVALHSEFAPTLAGLRRSLPRIAEANRGVEPANASTTGELFEYLGRRGGRAELRDRRGEARTADLGPLELRWLQPGDRLRAQVGPDGRARVFRCYPPESAGLLGT